MLTELEELLKLRKAYEQALIVVSRPYYIALGDRCEGPINRALGSKASDVYVYSRTFL